MLIRVCVARTRAVSAAKLSQFLLQMSVMSLSVQIFSVVSVAHTLIAEDGVISALMRTFLSECTNHKNPTTGKLAFDRNLTSISFK